MQKIINVFNTIARIERKPLLHHYIFFYKFRAPNVSGPCKLEIFDKFILSKKIWSWINGALGTVYMRRSILVKRADQFPPYIEAGSRHLSRVNLKDKSSLQFKIVFELFKIASSLVKEENQSFLAHEFR